MHLVVVKPVDYLGLVDSRATFPIHSYAPAFIELDMKLSMLSTQHTLPVY